MIGMNSHTLDAWRGRRISIATSGLAIPYFILLLIVVSYDILKHFQKDKLAIHKN